MNDMIFFNIEVSGPNICVSWHSFVECDFTSKTGDWLEGRAFLSPIGCCQFLP